MQRRSFILPAFFICFVLAIIIFFFANSTAGQRLTGSLQQITVPVQRFTFQSFQGPHHSSETELEKENKKLLTLLSKQKEIEKENKALKDQLETTEPAAKDLLPATVMGMREEEMIIDKGSSEGIKTGAIVVVKDNVIGQVVKTSAHLSVINLVTHRNTSFTAEAVKTSALGVIKGKGGNEIFFENVVLSDKLEKNDVVKTKGDIDKNGAGYPPGLIVGKIISVNKKTSALFQTAEIQSLVDFSRLSTVFVLKNN